MLITAHKSNSKVPRYDFLSRRAKGCRNLFHVLRSVPGVFFFPSQTEQSLLAAHRMSLTAGARE